MIWPNQSTEANAGELRLLAMRKRWAASVTQFTLGGSVRDISISCFSSPHFWSRVVLQTSQCIRFRALPFLNPEFIYFSRAIVPP